MKLSNQNKIVVGVIALILALTVGYAIFSETLNIGGTASASGEFSLIFNTVGEIKEVGSHGTTVTGEKTKALDIRNITLEYPSSYVEIPVTIKNVGTIDAKLKGIEVSNLSNGDITVTYSGVAQDEIIKATEEKEMKIKITWDEGSKTTLSTLEEFNIGLKYEQVTGENSGGESNPGGIVFPAVSGKLGDNVNFYYDNGVIDITGSGPITYDGEGLGLGMAISSKIAEELPTGNEKIDSNLAYLISAFVMGGSYGAPTMPFTKEQFKQMMITPEPDGAGLTEEEADKIIQILDATPKLKSLTIEDGITELPENFLAYVTIDSLIIPNSISSISYNTFTGVKIDTLYLGTGLTTLPENMFYDPDIKNHINNLIIPEGFTKFESYSLSRIQELTTLTIPSTVTEISENAIYDNPDLEVIINKTGKSFDWNAIINRYEPAGTLFETGTVVDKKSGKTITITK